MDDYDVVQILDVTVELVATFQAAIDAQAEILRTQAELLTALAREVTRELDARDAIEAGEPGLISGALPISWTPAGSWFELPVLDVAWGARRSTRVTPHNDGDVHTAATIKGAST